MKNLLITTAAIEAGAGVALVCFPEETSALLLGHVVSHLITTVSIQRIAGVALLTLAVANWLAHYDEKSVAAKGIVGAMIIYNLGTVGILTTASFQIHPDGPALWPAVALHSVMSIWCIKSLLKKNVPT